MTIEITELTIQDYDEVISLWRDSEGVGLSDSNAKPAIESYLQRNPGLSFVARDDGQIVGAVLCGHDGRRGYLHHLAVAPSHRRRQLGRTLVARCLAVLRAAGISKCHAFVLAGNPHAEGFWNAVGWTSRTDVRLISRFTKDAD